MADNWQDYQSEAASFFRNLGLGARVNHKVSGARATHTVDVWVTFSHFGIEVKWLVECKFWNSGIPKEKIMALMQISQDVGADKAFLLSERGFQSGTINAARNTNIVLSSLETLLANASEEICESRIAMSAKELDRLNDRLRALLYDGNGKWRRFSGLEPDVLVSALGVAFELQLCVSKASVQRYPILLLGSKTDGQTRCKDPKSFAKTLKAEVLQLEAQTIALEERANENRECANRTLLAAVEKIVAVSEKALFEKRETESGFEENRLAALAAMKELGEAFDGVKWLTPRSGAFEALCELREAVSDTVYLHLAKPTIPRSLWESTKGEVAAKVQTYAAAIRAEKAI
ncbi:MAG TPA: restriction endonuclease [Candidatus Binatia bacterium]|nr:restriction endonuclease [Candidatus Binatia bacterium]